MSRTPKPLRQQRRKLRMTLRRIDPGWNGKKPRFPKPIQLHDTEGHPVDASALVLRGRKLQEQLALEFALAAFASQEPEGPRQPIGQQVEVIGLLDSWMWGGGWADGPFRHHPGARLYLDYSAGERVYFQGFACKGILGWFRTDQMPKVRRLQESLQTEQDYQTALAARERIHGRAVPGTPEGDEYERLAGLIDAYEGLQGSGGQLAPLEDRK